MQQRPWKCCHSGDCCTQPATISVTRSEAAAMCAAAPHVTVRWRDRIDDSNFIELQAAPCPFYNDGCTIYDARPMNCRRYACGREDVDAEPFTGEPIPARFFSDRPFRRQMVLMQRRAQSWGRSHGWPTESA